MSSHPPVVIDARKVKSSAARLSGEARAMIAELESGRHHSMTIELPDEDRKHLVWLDGGTTKGQPARPLLTVTGRAREAAVQAILTKLRDNIATGKKLGMLPAYTVGGYALRAVYIDRLEHSGGDLRFRPLAVSYARFKSRRGLDPRIGVSRGGLLASLRRARVVISKTK